MVQRSSDADVEGLYSYSRSILYRCDNGLLSETGQEEVNVTCEANQMWTNGNFTCSGMLFQMTYIVVGQISVTFHSYKIRVVC